MKTLQNNFTTPEQSRRLLGLGLPADSADCYWHFVRRSVHSAIRHELRWLEPPYLDHYTKYIEMASGHDKYRENRLKTYLPCWSVGRLIEILKICMTSTLDFIDIIEKVRLYEDSLQILVQAFSEYEDVIDFSKLDD